MGNWNCFYDISWLVFSLLSMDSSQYFNCWNILAIFLHVHAETGYLWWGSLCQWCRKRCCLGRSYYNAPKTHQHCPPFSYGMYSSVILFSTIKNVMQIWNYNNQLLESIGHQTIEYYLIKKLVDGSIIIVDWIISIKRL